MVQKLRKVKYIYYDTLYCLFINNYHMVYNTLIL
jgi:hypothetical protein